MLEAVKAIPARTSVRPKIGLVLGSGLGVFGESLMHAARIPYRDIPGLPTSTAIGHASRQPVRHAHSARAFGTRTVLTNSWRSWIWQSQAAASGTILRHSDVRFMRVRESEFHRYTNRRHWRAGPHPQIRLGATGPEGDDGRYSREFHVGLYCGDAVVRRRRQALTNGGNREMRSVSGVGR